MGIYVGGTKFVHTHRYVLQILKMETQVLVITSSTQSLEPLHTKSKLAVPYKHR